MIAVIGFLVLFIFGVLYSIIMFGRMLKNEYYNCMIILKYFWSGLVTSSFYILSTLGLDYLPNMVQFKQLFWEQIIRITISCIIAFAVVTFQVLYTGWIFTQIIVLFGACVIVNIITILILRQQHIRI